MRTVIVFLLGPAVMLFPTIKTKLDPLMSVLLGGLIIGMDCGVGSSEMINALTGGFGNTCKSIGFVIIFGTIFGTYLEKPNSCQRAATSFLKVISEKNASVALVATGYLISAPVFSNVALIMLSSIIKVVLEKTGRVLCTFATLTAYALLCTNAYAAPTPTPLVVAAAVRLDVGTSIIHGLVVAAISTAIAGPFYMLFLDRKPAGYFTSTNDTGKKGAAVASMEESQILSFIEAILPILTPIILIVVNLICGTALAKEPPVLIFTGFVGDKDIALVIGIISAILLPKKRLSEGETFGAVEDVLKTVGPATFITAVGGILAKVVDATGAGQMFTDALAASFLLVILILLLATALSKFAQGPGSVAALLGTSFSIPLTKTELVSPIAALISISAGSHCGSHMNNSFFWVLAEFFGYGTKTILRIPCVVQNAVLTGTGLLCAWVISVVQNLMEVKKVSDSQFRGVTPPMVTPSRENGDVDYDAFVHDIKKWNNTGLIGYLVLGSNSEACYLNRQGEEEPIQLTVEHAADDKFVTVGTGLESIRQTIELTNHTASLETKNAPILIPCFFGGSMDSNALINCFTQVTDHVGTPVLLYNVPKFTYVNIEAGAAQKLASHPNILGMRDSSENVLQSVAYERMIPDSFNVMAGTTDAWYPAPVLGIKTGAHALANCCSDECAKIQELFDGGDWEGARDLYQRMFPVSGTVTDIYGIAGPRYDCDLMGYKGGYVRRSLQSLTDEKKTALGDIFESAGLLQGAITGGCSPIDGSAVIRLEDKVTIKFSSPGTQPMPFDSRHHLCYIQVRT